MNVKSTGATDICKITNLHQITHIWREKGTPDISNLSISKSTPIVAL